MNQINLLEVEGQLARGTVGAVSDSSSLATSHLRQGFLLRECYGGLDDGQAGSRPPFMTFRLIDFLDSRTLLTPDSLDSPTFLTLRLVDSRDRKVTCRVSMLDNDAAGWRYTKKLIRAVAQRGGEVQVLDWEAVKAI